MGFLEHRSFYEHGRIPNVLAPPRSYTAFLTLPLIIVSFILATWYLREVPPDFHSHFLQNMALSVANIKINKMMISATDAVAFILPFFALFQFLPTSYTVYHTCLTFCFALAWSFSNTG